MAVKQNCMERFDKLQLDVISKADMRRKRELQFNFDSSKCRGRDITQK